MEDKKMDASVRKSLKASQALSLLEGVCFFVAGICAFMADGILGWISGALLVILACMGIAPVFIGGDAFFLALGTSLAEDENVDEYGERIEEAKEK